MYQYISIVLTIILSLGFSGKHPDYFVFEGDTIYFAHYGNAINRSYLLDRGKESAQEHADLWYEEYTACNYNIDCEISMQFKTYDIPLFLGDQLSLIQPKFSVKYLNYPNNDYKITGYHTYYSDHSGAPLFFDTNLESVIRDPGWCLISKEPIPNEFFDVLEITPIYDELIMFDWMELLIDNLESNPVELRRIVGDHFGDIYKHSPEEQIEYLLREYDLQLNTTNHGLEYGILSKRNYNWSSHLITKHGDNVVVQRNCKVNAVLQLGNDVLIMTNGWKTGTGINWREVYIYQDDGLETIFVDAQFSG